jgi:hypothetical protein
MADFRPWFCPECFSASLSKPLNHQIPHFTNKRLLETTFESHKVPAGHVYDFSLFPVILSLDLIMNGDFRPLF